MDDSKTKRIHDELKAAGITGYGLTKMAIRELPHILHDDEHIKGILYGQIGGGNSATLVATDKRIVFVDKRMMFMTVDEVAYDVVSGIKVSSSGLFTTVQLHTKVNDYLLRRVNAQCARIFTSFIEKKRLEIAGYEQQVAPKSADVKTEFFDSNEHAQALEFLKAHESAVLSTIDRTGNVHGAVVYYVLDHENCIYILTKSETSKAKNIFAHNQVALTLHATGSLQTLQIQGFADVETDEIVKHDVMKNIVKLRKYNETIALPPVTKLHEGAFMVIRITPRTLRFHDYAKSE